MSRNSRPARENLARLSLESLETREVPATFLWYPQPSGPWDTRTYTSSAADPQNWVVALESRERATVAPGPDDDLLFNGAWSSADCTIPASLLRSATVGRSFHSISLMFDGEFLLPGEEPPVGWDPQWVAYTGTVTVQGSPSVDALTVQCGQIAQADATTLNPQIPYAPSAGTLTVNSTFSWTGGTLNSTSVAGTIALAPGATGVAEPSFTNSGINGTVYLGSTLELDASQMTLADGTYELDGGDFHALAGSLLLLAPVPKATPPSTPGAPSITLDNKGVTDPTVKVDAGSTLQVTTVGRVNNTDKVDVKVSGGGAQIHNQGLVVIEEYTRLIMAKTIGANFAEYVQNRAILFDPPVTKLQAGSEIKFEDNGDATKGCMNLTEGELLVYGVPGLTPQLEAAITAPANPTAPALFVGRDAKVNFHLFDHYVTLAITGDFTCEGEMNLRADGTTNQSDKITATGFMKMQTGQGAGLRTATLNVGWRVASGGPPAADTEWELLVVLGANGGIVTEPNSNIPTVTLPDTLTAGRLSDPKKYGMTFDDK